MDRFNTDAGYNFPAELREAPNWLLWKAVPMADKKTGKLKHRKVPKHVNGSGEAAAATDPATWGTYDNALEAFESWPGCTGLGFAFSSADRFVGIDLDDCMGPGGRLLPWAQAIADRFESYTELSPSGTGVHIIVKGQLPRDAGRRATIDGQAVEVYSVGRFFTMTGRLYRPDEHGDRYGRIGVRQTALDWLLTHHIGDGGFDGVTVASGDLKGASWPVEFNVTPTAETMTVIDGFRDNDATFSGIWSRSRRGVPGDGSPSAWDFVLLNWVKNNLDLDEWTDQKILDIVLAYRVKHKENLKLPGNKQYYERSIKRIRAEAAEGDSKPAKKKSSREIAEEKWLIKSDEARTDAVSVRDDDGIKARAIALSAIEDLFSLKIERYVQEGRENAVYTVYVYFPGAEVARPIIIGDAIKANSQNRWAQVIADVTERYPRVTKKATWSNFFDLLETIKVFEENAETETVGTLRDGVQAYLRRHGGNDLPEEGEEWKAAALAGQPFCRGGVWYLQAQATLKYMTEKVDKVLTKPAFMAALRAMGFENRRVTIRTGDNVKCRGFWQIKASVLDVDDYPPHMPAPGDAEGPIVRH